MIIIVVVLHRDTSQLTLCTPLVRIQPILTTASVQKFHFSDSMAWPYC